MKKLIVLLAVILAVFPNRITHQHRPIGNHVKIISEKELTCLAKNIFYEAPDESYEGKLAVATVTMNRVRSKSFPKTVCGVVYQRNTRGCQFSWTCGGKTKFDRAKYVESKKIAYKVLAQNLRLPTIKNALYFHNTSVSPQWDFARPIKKIGNHIFYVVVSKKPRLTNRNS